MISDKKSYNYVFSINRHLIFDSAFINKFECFLDEDYRTVKKLKRRLGNETLFI